jgi:phosphoribosyl 1,2-cyclic phosphodiesterase
MTPAVPAIAFRVLGSGSRGNATLVRFAAMDDAAGTAAPRHVLIDAGFSPRRLTAFLAAENLTPADLDAVLVTHADHDHFHPGCAAMVERYGMAVHVHRRHRTRLVGHGVTGRTLQLFGDEPFAVGRGDAADPGDPADPGDSAPRIAPIMCAHDDTGSAAFLIEHGGARLGWATDLGRVPPRLLEQFRDLDAVAIESNYDPPRQQASGRPAFLRQRITGGAGHLANEQALDAVLAIEAASPGGLGRVVLLHLSRDCNCPELVGELWRRRAAHLAPRLVVSEQDAPAPWVDVVPARDRAVQGSLFA